MNLFLHLLVKLLQLHTRIHQRQNIKLHMLHLMDVPFWEVVVFFSFLLSIPAIGGAAILAIRDVAETNFDTNWFDFALGMGVSGVTAYFCITIFLHLINRTSLMPYVIYRVVLGTFLLTLL